MKAIITIIIIFAALYMAYVSGNWLGVGSGIIIGLALGCWKPDIGSKAISTLTDYIERSARHEKPVQTRKTPAASSNTIRKKTSQQSRKGTRKRSGGSSTD